MGSLSLWGAGELIQVFISREKSAPESFFLALIRQTPPTPYLSGSEIDEVTEASYQRVEIPNDAGFWDADVQPQLMVLSQDISFVTAGEDWGVVRHWALCDTQVGGNCYFIGSLEAQQIVKTGDTVQVGAGDLSVALGSFFAEVT